MTGNASDTYIVINGKLTTDWLWTSLKSRQYENNNTIANLWTASFYLLSSLFLYIHCNTYTH